MSEEICFECGKKSKENLAKVAGLNGLILICKDCLFKGFDNITSK
jgi:hypothetical protein